MDNISKGLDEAISEELANPPKSIMTDSPQPAPRPSEEEKELFAAATKIDIAKALKHLREWRAYIDDHHRQKYADLIEAQAKLIAWLVNRDGR